MGKCGDLGKLLIKHSETYDRLFKAVNSYAINNKRTLDFKNQAFNRGYITLEDISVVFTANISMLDNTVKFDAVIAGEFTLERNYAESLSETLWFKLTCEMVIRDEITWFKVLEISEYIKERAKPHEFPATENFVPIIGKKDLEGEAERFLIKYYPEALNRPMSVPVREIAQKLGLTVIEGFHFGEGKHIFGAICFHDCQTRMYDDEENEVELSLKSGSIIVDNNVFFMNNAGCVNNTIAHELFHWHRHRLYAIVQRLLDKDYPAACRCIQKNALSAERTDNDWMEWQANSIAPKILMPKKMFEQKARELFKNYGIDLNLPCCDEDELWSAVKELAAFFQVSVQSALIRLTEMGIENLDELYAKRYKARYTFEIEPCEFYSEYKYNPAFRKLIDSSDFLYVENHCVLNNRNYITEDSIGRLSLSDYAIVHKEECCLSFSETLILNRKRLQELSTVFFRGEEQSFAKCKHLADEIINGKVLDKSDGSARLLFEKAHAFDAKIMDSLTNDIGDCFANIIEIYRQAWGLDGHKVISEIESQTLITKKTLSDIKLKKVRPKKETIVAFCVGLHLSEEVCNELLKRAGHALTLSKEDYAYKMLLTGFRQVGIDGANSLLESWGMTPLGSAAM